MRNALVIVVVASSLSFAAPNTQALGFGRTANATQLGQTLNFAAMIQLGGDETLARECVAAEVFSGENKLPASQIRVTLEPGNEPGERSVRVTSTSLIDEPVVTINVTVGCGARLSRRFVAFIDPPLVNLAQSDTTEPEKLAPQKLDSRLAPLLAIMQAANESARQPAASKLSPPIASATNEQRAVASDRPPRAARSANAERPATRSAAAKGAGSKRTASAAQVVRNRKAPAGAPPVVVAGVAKSAKAGSVSRLQLEPSVAMADRFAPLPRAAEAASSVAPGASGVPASAPDAQTALLTVERQRIQRLEEGAARLSAESKATRDALTQVQSRLQAAEAARYANPLVYALAALAALFAALSIWLWRRQPRAAETPHWWVAGSGSAAAAPVRAAPESPGRAAPIEAAAEVEPAESLVSPSPAESAWEGSRSMRLPAGSSREIVAPDALTMPGGTAGDSVDQLIDLEQQAEFFIVLGQDDAAADLLMAHVRSSGGASPLPYLNLLEIYQRCDDHAAYDRIRARFNRRFDAVAPAWGADLRLGRALVDYPDLLGRLQELWRAPEAVMHALEAALFRRTKTDATVDLPAYRELLFLFTIARDLSGRELVELAPHDGGHAVVDLFLPIGDRPIAAAPTARESAADMTVTRTFTPALVARANRSAPLDFDLSLPIGMATELEHIDAAATVSGEPPAKASNHIDFNDLPTRPSEVAHQR